MRIRTIVVSVVAVALGTGVATVALAQREVTNVPAKPIAPVAPPGTMASACLRTLSIDTPPSTISIKTTRKEGATPTSAMLVRGDFVQGNAGGVNSCVPSKVLSVNVETDDPAMREQLNACASLLAAKGNRTFVLSIASDTDATQTVPGQYLVFNMKNASLTCAVRQ